MDPDRIIIGGRSRGSVVSWSLAQSAHPAIVSIYMYNALPAVVWGGPTWSPVDEVTANAPPTYLVCGIGDRFTLYQDMWGDFHDAGGDWTNAYAESHYLPELIAPLEAGPAPGDMLDEFDGGNTAYNQFKIECPCGYLKTISFRSRENKKAGV